jgi:hypothetical protein
MLSTTPTITTSMVEVSVLQQLAPTMAVVTQQTTMTDMEAAQVAQLHVLTTVEDLQLTFTIDTAAVQAVLQLARTMVEELPQITMTDMEAA